MKINFLIFCFALITQSIVAQDFFISKNKKHQPYTRLAFSSGYAYRFGKFYETGYPDFDRLSEKIRPGFHLDGELQYLFHKDFGVGIIVNHVRQSASAENIRLPKNVFPVKSYKESHAITFLGPEIILHEENRNWLLTLSTGIGATFLHIKMTANDTDAIGTSVNWGVNSGFGVQYKFSYDFAAGLKLSITGGTTETLKVEGKNIYDAPVAFSFSNIMLSAYCSFRLN